MDSNFHAMILHKNPQLIDACCELINAEWPRSLTARYVQNKIKFSSEHFSNITYIMIVMILLIYFNFVLIYLYVWKFGRRRGLECSCDNLPTSLVLVNNENGNKPDVVGHSKITTIPSLPEGAFIESGMNNSIKQICAYQFFYLILMIYNFICFFFSCD